MLFIDTGALLARYLPSDQYHGAAVRGWSALKAVPTTVFTSNFVLDEFFTLLARRAGYSFAAERARIIYASPQSLRVLRPQEQDEVKAVALMSRYADQAVSFTDCVSFTLMRAHRIVRAFTFDAHFEYAGFTIWMP